MSMYISAVTQYVADQDAAIAFWTGVMGFELRTDAEMWPGSRWVEVAPPGGQTALALLQADDFPGATRSGPAPFTIVVDDIAGYHARLVALGAVVTAPVEEGYGTFVQVTTPDGWEQVVSQLAPPPAG